MRPSDSFTLPLDLLIHRVAHTHSRTVPKELYRKLSLSTFRNIEITAVYKLKKAYCVEGAVTTTSLTKAMTRKTSTPSNNRSLRTASEFCRGAVRTAKHLIHIPEINKNRPCAHCFIYKGGTKFSGINRILNQCGIIHYLILRVSDLLIYATSVKVPFTLNQLILLKFEDKILQKLKPQENI